MILTGRTRPTQQLAKLILLAIVWAAIWLPLQLMVSAPAIQTRFTASTAFVLGIVITFVTIAAFQIAFIFVLCKIEKVQDFRSFFRIERLDVPGIWLTVGLGIAVQILNAGFLWKFVLKPARDFLLSVGIPGAPIGLGTGEMVPQLSPSQAMFLTVFLLLFWWLEVPEELFFRGYLQNRSQQALGKNLAMVFSALVWALSHLWGLANTLERVIYGLVYAIAFRSRQNTSGPMIVHSLGNRALLLGVILPQIFNRQADTQVLGAWLFVAVIYAILILLVIAAWRMLELDKPE